MPNAAYSVLEAHQAKNCKAHAPNFHALSTASAIQTHQPIQNPQLPHERIPEVQDAMPKMNDEDDGPDEDLQPSDNNSDEEPFVKRCASHNSQTSHGPKPTQMGYYRGAWADVLEDSKCLYCLHLHTNLRTFPECNEVGLKEAHDCLCEAAAHFEDIEGNFLDHGSFSPVLHVM